MIALAFNSKIDTGVSTPIEQASENMFYQDSFFFYQKPRCVQNNFLVPPPPQYSSHLLDEGRICSPSQPCFIAKQTNAFSHQPAESFVSNGAPRLPFDYGTTNSLLPPTVGKLEFQDPPSSEIIHPLPVYFRVKSTLRTPGGKRCRKSRTVFTDLQLRVLEKTFSEQRYLDSTSRAKLSQILGLNEAQVKTWFQNRRMKWKKKLATTDKPDSSTTPKKREQVESKDNKEVNDAEKSNEN